MNTVLYRSRTDEEVWEEILADTLAFVSIDKTAERLGLSHDHVFPRFEDLCKTLFTDNVQNSSFSNQSLKNWNLLDL